MTSNTVVAIGNPSDGFRYVGPFTNATDANLWADDNAPNNETWWIIDLDAPEDDARACSCGQADYGTPGHDGAGYWIVAGPDGDQLAGPFDTEQDAEDESEAMREPGDTEDALAVAYVNA
jgi:hypothetical protein